MKHAIAGLSLAASLVLTAGLSYAVDPEAGTVRSNIVALQGGARPAAMGGAFTAVSDDNNAIYHNMAGFGFFSASEFSATQTSGFADFDLSDLTVAIPLGDVTTSNVRQLGTIVLSIGTLDYGNQEALNATGGNIGRLEASDDTLAVGWGKALNNRFSLGALGRIHDSEIFAHSETDTVYDAGALFRAVPGRLNVAVAGSDIGKDSPTEYRGALAITPAGDLLLVSLEGGTAEDRGSIFRAGFEVRPSTVLALRVGYDNAFDAGNGISFGAGIQLLDLEIGFFPLKKVSLDYAFTPVDDLESLHRVSISARIGTQ